MTSRLVALGHDDVDAGLDVTPRVLDGARERRHLHALLASRLDHPRRRRSERARDQADPVLEDELDHVALQLVADADLRSQGGADRERRHVVLRQQLVDEAPMRLWNSRVELRSVEAALVAAHEPGGQQQVHAVRLVTDLVLDPLELHAQVPERVSGHAEHAESPRLRDGRRYVAAVGEGEDGKLETQLRRELRVHRIPPGARLRPARRPRPRSGHAHERGRRRPPRRAGSRSSARGRRARVSGRRRPRPLSCRGSRS
jgi:hypothetical protein